MISSVWSICEAFALGTVGWVGWVDFQMFLQALAYIRCTEHSGGRHWLSALLIEEVQMLIQSQYTKYFSSQSSRHHLASPYSFWITATSQNAAYIFCLLSKLTSRMKTYMDIITVFHNFLAHRTKPGKFNSFVVQKHREVGQSINLSLHVSWHEGLKETRTQSLLKSLLYEQCLPSGPMCMCLVCSPVWTCKCCSTGASVVRGCSWLCVCRFSMCVLPWLMVNPSRFYLPKK